MAPLGIFCVAEQMQTTIAEDASRHKDVNNLHIYLKDVVIDLSWFNLDGSPGTDKDFL
jgi:hypothetical protein